MGDMEGASAAKHLKLEDVEEEAQQKKKAEPPPLPAALVFVVDPPPPPAEPQEEDIMEMDLGAPEEENDEVEVQQQFVIPHAIAGHRTDQSLTIRAIAKIQDPRVGTVRPRGVTTVQRTYVGKFVWPHRPKLTVQMMERGEACVQIAETDQSFLPEKFARLLRLHEVPWHGARRFCDRRGRDSSFQVFYHVPCRLPETPDQMDPPVFLVFSTFEKKWRVVESNPQITKLIKGHCLPLVDGNKLFLVVIIKEEPAIDVYELDLTGNTVVMHKLVRICSVPQFRIYLEPYFLRISDYRLFAYSPVQDAVKIFNLKIPCLSRLCADVLYESRVTSVNDELTYNQFLLRMFEGVAVAGIN